MAPECQRLSHFFVAQDCDFRLPDEVISTFRVMQRATLVAQYLQRD
jgi:hypothetical protein